MILNKYILFSGRNMIDRLLRESDVIKAIQQQNNLSVEDISKTIEQIREANLWERPMRRVITIKLIYDISDPAFEDEDNLTKKEMVEEMTRKQIQEVFECEDDLMDIKIECEDI